MLYKEDIHALGFFCKTQGRRIYHHQSLNLLMEVIMVYEEYNLNRLKERIIVWEPEITLVTKQPILHRGPDTEVLLDLINPTKKDIEDKLKEYEQRSI